MKNLMKSRVRVVKKSEPKQTVVMRCGARVFTITFDADSKGTIKYHSDYSIVPKYIWYAENNAKTEI